MGYIGMCRCEGYGFQAVYSRIGYINQSVWVQNRVLFFRKLISYLDYGLWYKVLFWLVCASEVSSFWKTATLGYGGLGEFTLVQGSKIQMNQLCYRLRVPGSQRHIPSQKFPHKITRSVLRSISILLNFTKLLRILAKEVHTQKRNSGVVT